MSAQNKRINKKTATKVPVSSSSSPFSQFPRIVGPAGVTTPAQPTTIPQAFQEQQALIAHTTEWHAETRQKIIDTIAQFPGTPSVQVLTGLTSSKLTNQALRSFTITNPTGIFGTADSPVHLDQLLLALQMSAPNKHQSDAIHRSINEALARIESESFAQALDQHEDVQTPSSHADPSVATTIPPPLKRSREMVPLDLLPVKEARITQFKVATQSVPPDRPAHQRQVKGTSFFGDLIQANSVQHLATSRLVGPSQARPRARSSGLATNTRPGRSGEDTRPGMTSGPQRKVWRAQMMGCQRALTTK
jgi:hypothetical protein